MSAVKAVNAVTVRYFAALRELLGHEQESVAVSDGAITFVELLDHLRLVHGDEIVDRLIAPGVRLAVNDELVEGAAPALAGGDRIAFLPPVTGG